MSINDSSPPSVQSLTIGYRYRVQNLIFTSQISRIFENNLLWSMSIKMRCDWIASKQERKSCTQDITWNKTKKNGKIYTYIKRNRMVNRKKIGTIRALSDECKNKPTKLVTCNVFKYSYINGYWAELLSGLACVHVSVHLCVKIQLSAIWFWPDCWIGGFFYCYSN